MPSKKETPIGRTKTAQKSPKKIIKVALKKPKNEPVRTIKIAKAANKPTVVKKSSAEKKAKPAKAPEKEVVINNLNVLLMEKRKAAKGSKSSKSDDQTVVTLPPSISLRAKDKAGAYFSVITHDFEHSAMRISYTAAFCFMVLGSFLALSGSSSIALRTFDRSIVEESLSSQMAAPLSSGPRLTIFEQIPETISELSQHTFSFTNADNIKASLLSRDDGAAVPLEIFTSSDDIYQIRIDPATLSRGTYELRISGRAKDSQILYTKTATEFTIAKSIVSEETASTSEEVEEDEATVDEVVEEVDAVAEEETSEETMVSEAVVSDDTSVSIALPDTLLTSSELLLLQAPESVTSVEIWVRPIKTSQLHYLGTAKRSAEGFSFYFDTTTIPDGDYVLIGKTRHENDYVEVETQKFSVRNVIGDVASGEPVVLGEATTTQSERTFADIDSTVESASSSVRSDESVIGIIDEYQSELKEVFQRYAVAVQAKDTLLIDLAKARIEEVKAKIMKGVLQDDTYNEQANAIEIGLTAHLEEIMKRTDSFEEIRQIASPDAWKDTDNDGISDVDETLVFGSDPTKVDTDNDGVLDGIEIIEGYDPLVADFDTPVTYESPLDSIAPADTQLLGITAVLPMIEYKDNGEVRSTEIKGWSYPNSFVTVYLFSKPLTAKVKTDENGYFSLILDKELDDGEHEVYAAITDNKGAIVLQSSVYRFVKDGPELLALADGASLPYMQATVVTPQSGNPSNVVAGIGILALGLVLLMLSISLRRREKISAATEVKASA